MRNPKSGQFSAKYYIGQKIGKLTLLHDTRKRSHGYYIWVCLCECGVEIEQATYQIRDKPHCGCSTKHGRKRTYFDPSFNTMYHHVKNGAKVRGIRFLLTREDVFVITKQNCFYCGVEPLQETQATTATDPYIANGIDRLDSGGAYEAKNCVPCCKHCNWAKRCKSIEGFREWIIKVHNHFILSDLLPAA